MYVCSQKVKHPRIEVRDEAKEGRRKQGKARQGKHTSIQAYTQTKPGPGQFKNGNVTSPDDVTELLAPLR